MLITLVTVSCFVYPFLLYDQCKDQNIDFKNIKLNKLKKVSIYKRMLKRLCKYTSIDWKAQKERENALIK